MKLVPDYGYIPILVGVVILLLAAMADDNPGAFMAIVIGAFIFWCLFKEPVQ